MGISKPTDMHVTSDRAISRNMMFFALGLDCAWGFDGAIAGKWVSVVGFLVFAALQIRWLKKHQPAVHKGTRR